MKNSYSEGVDGIRMPIIKTSINILAVPLCYIFNSSIAKGSVPNQLKIAKVLPIYKSNDCHNFSNFRPISILPCFSKILEKVMYKRFMDFLYKFQIINHHQYGFRKNHSTFMAILELVNGIYHGFENNMLTVGVFLDLKKAFDTVNHDILIDKMSFYGFRGNALSWIKSYLGERSQYVEINNVQSSPKTIKCGVPQGSVLGPLLFLVFINDIFNTSNCLSFILFADDTNIFYSDKNINSLINTLNHELVKVASWLRANKLTLHPDKTKFILFHPGRKKNIC